MEYLDILDADGNKTKKNRSREDVHRLGLWHKTIHVWIVNDNNEVLLQKRSPQVESNPNLWDISFAGHVEAGDSMKEAIKKEGLEELGLNIDINTVQYIYTYPTSKTTKDGKYINNEFKEIYLIRLNVKIDNLELQKEEVSEVKYVDLKELKRISDEKDKAFTSNYGEYLEVYNYILKLNKNKELFAVYKPKGPSSNKVLNIIRKIVGTKKVGHAGTLDPLASGVLVVGIGRDATKQLNTAVEKEKEYIAKILLGQRSTTYDYEGKKTGNRLKQLLMYFSPIKKEKIESILKEFEGEIMQKPPIFSALKIKGKPAYKLAREGQEVNLREREVNIKKIELLKYRWPYLKIKVTTGPGVYIRSLAHDIGEKLEIGAYLRELERTRVGEFTKEKAKTLEELKKEYKKFTHQT